MVGVEFGYLDSSVVVDGDDWPAGGFASVRSTNFRMVVAALIAA